MADLTPDQAAAELQTTRNKLMRLVNRHRIPVIRPAARAAILRDRDGSIEGGVESMPLRVITRTDTGTLWIVGTATRAGTKTGYRIRQRAGTDDEALAREEASVSNARSSATTTSDSDPSNVVSLPR